MYSIVLQTIFYKYQNKNHIMNDSLVCPALRPLRANKIFKVLKAIDPSQPKTTLSN